MNDAAEVSHLVAGEVRAWMARRQITANQAAPRLGWSQTYLSRRLTGSVTFSVEDLAALAELLEVSPAVFFDAPESNWTSSPAHPRRSGPRIRSSCFTPATAAAAALSTPGGHPS